MSDLTMCGLAVDRRGVRVAKHFNLMHPVVFKLVKMINAMERELKVEYVVTLHLNLK
jgi:pyruvate, water dikinase